MEQTDLGVMCSPGTFLLQFLIPHLFENSELLQFVLVKLQY